MATTVEKTRAPRSWSTKAKNANAKIKGKNRGGLAEKTEGEARKKNPEEGGESKRVREKKNRGIGGL